MRKTKSAKSKRVSYTLLLDQRDGPNAHAPLYALLSELINAHHRELIGAFIGLAWCTSWRADVDGRQRLGQCKRASDLDRECAPFDFVILLNHDFVTNPAVTDAQRLALLDHELMHATVKLDPQTHEPMVDERGRTVYRLRKHDIEEFGDVVERHGLWKKDLEHFAVKLRRAKQPELPLASGEPHIDRELVLGDDDVVTVVAGKVPKAKPSVTH